MTVSKVASRGHRLPALRRGRDPGARNSRVELLLLLLPLRGAAVSKSPAAGDSRESTETQSSGPRRAGDARGPAASQPHVGGVGGRGSLVITPSFYKIYFRDAYSFRRHFFFNFNIHDNQI